MDELQWVSSIYWYDTYVGSTLGSQDTPVGTFHGATKYNIQPIITLYMMQYIYDFH